MRRVALAALVSALLAACGGGATGTETIPLAPDRSGAARLRVQGNQLVDASGRRVHLRGVNRSGTEYACAQGWGIFDGPSDSASVAAIASWKANAVRVPLNEHCWLGVNGVPADHGGERYRRAVADFVGRINRAGMTAIVELHWSGPGTARALGQQPMPDRDHSPAFWRSVATTFTGNDAVVLDLFNEPYPDGNADTPEAWRCWRDGGSCRGLGYQAAGMQELVDAVRSTGATNVILLGGVQYAATLSRWLEYRPSDPRDNLAASWHVYNFSWCSTRACWDATAGPVAQQAPLVLGELGQDDRGSAFVTSLMDWMDARPGGGHYLAWVWNVWGSPLDLVAAYDGTPTPYGATFRARFGR